MHDHDTWADDVNNDEYSGVAVVENQIYSSLDSPTNLHPLMHKNFFFSSNDHYVYGILTAFNYLNLNQDKIRKAFTFYVTYLTTELLDKTSSVSNENRLNSAEEDAYYTQILTNSFKVTEEIFGQVQSDILCEKTVLDDALKGVEPEKYPKIRDQLKEIKQELSLGFSAVVLLIRNKRIHVANIGNTRAILCKKVLADCGEDRIVSVEMTVRHDLKNGDELRRLSQVGVDTTGLTEEIGNMSLTRCLGNLWLKNFYKDYTDLKRCKDDPIITVPSVCSIPIDDCCLFFILASDSLFQTLQEALEKSDVLDDLFEIIGSEIQKYPDLKHAAQSVISHVCDLHITRFHESVDSHLPTICRQLDDITLLIRKLSIDSEAELFRSFNSSLNELRITVDDENVKTNTSVESDNTLVNRNVIETTSKKFDPDGEVDAYVDLTELLNTLDVNSV